METGNAARLQEFPGISGAAISVRIVSKTCALIGVAEFDDDCSSFIRQRGSVAPLPLRLATFVTLVPSRTGALWLGNDEHDLALRPVSFVMREEFIGGTAPKFFESFCELSRNAKLPIRYNIDAGGKRFGQSIRRLEKDYCFAGFSGCSQFALALPCLYGQKSPERKFFGRKTGPHESGHNRRWSRDDRERKFSLNAFANET
jgi:hypothetical protein